MHLYESNSHDMMKSFKRSRGLLCLVTPVSPFLNPHIQKMALRIHLHNQLQRVMTQGQAKEFQDQDLVTRQEPFETVQLPQISAYSVVQQFARCPNDLDDALLQQLELRTIVQQLLGGIQPVPMFQ